MSAENLQLISAIAGQEHGGGPQDRGLGLQPLHETTQVELRGCQILDDSRPVDDEEGGIALACHTTDGGDDAVQTLVREGIEEIEIVHPIADERGIEESEAAQVGQHQIVSLGEEGSDQRLATRGRVMKGELVTQRRLTDTG